MKPNASLLYGGTTACASLKFMFPRLEFFLSRSVSLCYLFDCVTSYLTSARIYSFPMRFFCQINWIPGTFQIDWVNLYLRDLGIVKDSFSWKLLLIASSSPENECFMSFWSILQIALTVSWFRYLNSAVQWYLMDV